MTEVLEHLAIKPQVALVDAMPIVSAGIETVSLIHGDALSASIAAASIIAKVTRDRMMIELAEQYPRLVYFPSALAGSSYPGLYL